MATKRSKYNVSSNTKNRTYDGITFDSKLECDFYREWLLPNVESGFVVKYELQKTYELQPAFNHDDKKIRPINYVSDFSFTTKNGTEVVIDIKGMATPDANMKRKMMWYTYPNLQFYWVTKCQKYGGWIEYDELKKKRKQNKKEKENGKN